MRKNDFSKYRIRTEFWSYEKLSKLEPIVINRDTDIRLSKVYKRLVDKYLPTHSTVIVGHVTKPFDCYEEHDMFRLDGNTRMEVYKIKPELIPDTPFLVIIYDIDCWEDAKDIYDSIDNKDAAESTSEKITGILRYKEYDANSELVKKGKFKRAIDIVSLYDVDSDGVRINTLSTEDKINRYWEYITYIDELGITNMEKRWSAGVFACLIMVAKKYGLDHERFDLLYNNLQDGLTTVNDKDEVDGVHYVYHTLYDKFKDSWTNTGMYNTKKTHIVLILYGFDMFMKNENISKKTKIDKQLSSTLKTFFENYLREDKMDTELVD